MKSFKKKACKVLSAVLSVMMTTSALTGIMTTNVSAATIADQNGNFVYTDLDDGTIEITKCNSNGDVDIPSSIDGKTVTTIGEYAFSDGVTSVSIPESVKTIQDYAFYNCYSLEDIEFSEGLTYIGKEAFYSCNIQALHLPETLEEIDDYAFSGNYGIYDLSFPETRGVKIGLDALPTGSWYWSKPDGPIISGKTFVRYKAYNAYIPEYTIPDGIETIAPYAFSDLYSTQKINIPDSVKYVCEYAFANTNIQEAILPDGVEFIGHRAFEYCYSLKNVTLPNSLTYIGSNAFSHCENLTDTIAIPDSVTYLGDYAFAYTNINGLEISDNNNITYFGSDILAETPWYEAQPYGEIYFNNIFADLKTNSEEPITELSIKDGTKVIASYALYNFSGNLDIPDSVEYVNSYGLAYTNITDSNFPKNIKEIGDHSFDGCYALTELEIPSTLKTIGKNAFYECKNLTSISDTKNVTSIGDNAFSNTAIETFKIGSGLNKLGRNIFYNNSVLKEFTVSSQNNHFSAKDGVLYNKDRNIMIIYPYAKADTKLVITSDILSFTGAFESGNPNITEIVIEEGVLNIPANAFENLYKVQTITIPTTVKKIGKKLFPASSDLHTVNYNAVDCTATNAFESCGNLTTVNFGENVNEISDEMFACCSNLENVNLNGKIEFIGTRAFYSTKWDDNIRDCAEGEIVYVDKIAYCSNNPTGDIEIKDGTTSIYDYIFTSCTSITSATLPDSIKYIGSYSFNSCSNLENIEMSSSIESIGSNAFNYCSKLTEIDLGNKLTYLGDCVFRDCSSLKSITIPLGVEAIQDYAFSSCSSLTNITLGKGTTYIGEYAFAYTSSLNTLTLPSTVKKIEYDAFYYSGIKSIELNEGLDTIGSWAFQYCENLESITCPSTLETIANHAFSGCRALKTLTLNEGLETIEQATFQYCEALESVEIPSTVKSVGYDSFSGCSSLKNVTLNEGLESIGDYAFGYCSTLESIVLPSTVKSIGYNSFSSCSSLKNITLNEGLENIGSSAFYGTAIESIEIPTTIKEINYGVFSNCANLKSVTLHEGLIDIYYGAFHSNPNLTEILIPSTVNYIDEYSFDNDMIIYGYEGSYAQIYVEEHYYSQDLNHTFVAIERTIGDINGDGIVTVTDATELQKYLAGMITLTDKQLASADITSNGNIDIKDVSYITKALAGIVEL